MEYIHRANILQRSPSRQWIHLTEGRYISVLHIPSVSIQYKHSAMIHFHWPSARTWDQEPRQAECVLVWTTMIQCKLILNWGDWGLNLILQIDLCLHKHWFGWSSQFTRASVWFGAIKSIQNKQGTLYIVWPLVRLGLLFQGAHPGNGQTHILFNETFSILFSIIYSITRHNGGHPIESARHGHQHHQSTAWHHSNGQQHHLAQAIVHTTSSTLGQANGNVHVSARVWWPPINTCPMQSPRLSQATRS